MIPRPFASDGSGSGASTNVAGRLLPTAIMTDVSRTIRRVQGLYYVATGLWPVVAVDSYMSAAGQESHAWAARTLGAAVAAVGVALAAELVPDRVARGLALGTAVVLAAGATYFAARGKGVPVNVTDGLLQAGFAAFAGRSIVRT